MSFCPAAASGRADPRGRGEANLAKELGRLHDWREKFWGRRYRQTVISDEPEAQLASLKYLIAQGTQAGLVASPLDWPGLNCAKELLEDHLTT